MNERVEGWIEYMRQMGCPENRLVELACHCSYGNGVHAVGCTSLQVALILNPTEK